MKLLPLLLLLLVACNNDSTSSANDADSSLVKDKQALEDESGTECFRWTANKDTVTLSLSRGTGVRNGILIYNWSEKDSNKGNWTGNAEGDVLMGWYNFQSEGLQSVRQVAWQRHGDELWPALGAVTEKADTSYFIDASQLRFDSTMPMKKVVCEQ